MQITTSKATPPPASVRVRFAPALLWFINVLSPFSQRRFLLLLSPLAEPSGNLVLNFTNFTIDYHQQGHAMGRLLRPVDIAATVGHLLSDASAMMTGTIVDLHPEMASGSHDVWPG